MMVEETQSTLIKKKGAKRGIRDVSFKKVNMGVSPERKRQF